MPNVALGAALASVSLLFGCASKTTLVTTPPGADVYVNGGFQGVSPVEYSDSRTILGTNRVRFELDGYQTKTASFRRNHRVDPVATVFYFVAVFPILWIRNYEEEYRYELEPMAELLSFAKAYRDAAASVELGDRKRKVLSALMPTQAGIDPRSKRAPESFVKADGVKVDIYYLRSNVQPDGRIDKNDYTPYVFNDDELVSVGWGALDRSDAR